MAQATTWDTTLWEAGLFMGDRYHNCHNGTTKIMSLGRRDGGSMYIGGRGRSTNPNPEMPVIDLTGQSQPQGHKATWYGISIPSYGIPKWSMYFWEQLAMTVYHEMSQGDITILSQGGHGRVSVVTTILAYILKDKRYMQVPQATLLTDDPVKWIETIHCEDSLDSIMQNICIYETCNKFSSNPSLSLRLAELEIVDPRYIYYPDIYSQQEEVEDKLVDNSIFTCPVCLEEHATMIQAIACHSNDLTTCPVCTTNHDLPVEAYTCCN
jgi:hypothetical protein